MNDSIDTDDIVDLSAEYIAYLRIERGSSPRTIEAYEADLQKYQDFLISRDIERLSAITRDDIVAFEAHLFECGFAASTVSRRISVVKGFHRFCVAEDYTQENPAAALPLPKTPERLPDVLAIDQVNKLFDALDGEGAAGVRDRAMLEVLYGCGLRVSELVGLNVSDVLLDQGYLLVTGKGDKQRISPISGAADRALRAYLDTARTQLQSPTPSPPTRCSSRARRQAHAPKRVQGSAAAPGAPSGWTTFIRTRCATRSPRTCLKAGRTCASSRTSSGTPTSPPRRSTRTSIARTCARNTCTPTRAHKLAPVSHRC